MRIFVRIFLLSALSICLFACGQRGPLELPKQPAPNTEAEPSTTMGAEL